MAVTFEVREHSLKRGVSIVEIKMEGEVVAAIYPDEPKGIKVVSAHIKQVQQDDGARSIPPIPAVLIKFDPQPYEIRRGRIVKLPKS